MSTTYENELNSIRELLANGEEHTAGQRLDTLMNRLAGRPDREVLLLFAEYLLRRGRPFSAERVLKPLVKSHTTTRGQLLTAQSIAEQGDSERSRDLAASATGESSGPIDVRLLTIFDEQVARQSNDAMQARIDSELRGHPVFENADPYAVELLERVDTHLSELARDGRPTSKASSELWGYYLGEICRRHAGGVWQWRRRLSESTMLLASDIEFNPTVWISWRLNHNKHHLRRLLAVLMYLDGVDPARIAAVVGAEAATFPRGDYEPQWGRHALSEALEFAVREDAQVLGLGLRADCPFAAMQVPLIVRGPAGPESILFWNTPEEEESFRRYLDMLCLSEMARFRWRIESGSGKLPEDIALYQRADGGVRAGLLARRLVKPEPAHNARWLVAVADVLFDVVLDGSRASLDTIDSQVLEKVRLGGPNRWGKLFDERHPILFMVTSYVGEVLRASCGGEWGADRITGEAMGPTSGLEIGDVRFNLGAKVLRRFYGGAHQSIIPTMEQYEQAAAAARAR